MSVHETEHFRFELDDRFLTIQQTQPTAVKLTDYQRDCNLPTVRIPKTEFGEALVGFNIVHIATVQYEDDKVIVSTAKVAEPVMDKT